jgi:hypothetical protein
MLRRFLPADATRSRHAAPEGARAASRSKVSGPRPCWPTPTADTNAGFDANLRPTGVTLGHVLEEILGLEYVDEAEDATLNPNDPADLERILANYSTRTIAGVDTPWRVAACRTSSPGCSA